MRVLFCSPCPLDPRLGAAKVLLDLADAWQALGGSCDLVDPLRLKADETTYPARLYDYVQAHADAYDVVDFAYERLAFTRHAFSSGPLFVARSQLLHHHFPNVRFPPEPSLRARLRARALAPLDRRRVWARIRRDNITLKQADLVVVLNERDRELLALSGIPIAKIHVLPNGMSEERRRAFNAVPVDPPAENLIAFIGMYGPRKGAADFPDLMRRVVAAAPEARFRLLGTRGRFKTDAEVYALLPRALRSRVEVIPAYAPEVLPDLLAPCSVGVFPSYLEGFPLGVLEMLSAAVPVVAYDAPGAPEMLPPAYLVAPGDTGAMSQKVVGLLQDRASLQEARRWARRRAQEFRWKDITRVLMKTYEDALALKRAGRKPGEAIQEAQQEG